MWPIFFKEGNKGWRNRRTGMARQAKRSQDIENDTGMHGSIVPLFSIEKGEQQPYFQGCLQRQECGNPDDVHQDIFRQLALKAACLL